MEIKKMKITEIKAAAYNPRKKLKVGDPEYEKLKKAIKEFDLVEPLICNHQPPKDRVNKSLHSSQAKSRLSQPPQRFYS